VPTEFIVAPEHAGSRLDRHLAWLFPDLSRTRIQELIHSAFILVDGHPAKDSLKLKGGERVTVDAQPRPPLEAIAENIPLDVLYEDGDLIVINKPAGMTVHAGAGTSHGTLVNALLGRGQSLSSGSDALRPGIVHRLDRETSGAILVAKNDFAHARLSEAFRQRQIKKTYIALVQGSLKGDRGSIDFAIGRDPHRRTRMTARRTAVAGKSRAALTEWRALASIGPATLVEVTLHTGRTHQIRVHFSALKHPVVGDTLYGASEQLLVGKMPLPPLGRNFLHAARLGFAQPRTAAWLDLRAHMPPPLREFLHQLAAAAGESSARIDAALAAYL
jgi:23S rRNA pseudouridine1911/1915/1917 synthase